MSTKPVEWPKDSWASTLLLFASDLFGFFYEKSRDYPLLAQVLVSVWFFFWILRIAAAVIHLYQWFH